MKAALVRELRTSYPEAELDHWQQAASWLMASGVRLAIELDSTQLWLEPGWNGLQPLSQMCIRAAVDRATTKGDERRMRPRSVEIRSPPPPVITTGGACQLSGVHRATQLINSSVVVERMPGSDKGPRASIARLIAELENNTQNKEWAERARLEALCGSSQRSAREVASVLRAWEAFATPVLGLKGAELLPPSLDGLLAWSRHFSNSRTFGNYVGKLILVCEVLRLPTDSLKHASVGRACRTIKSIAAAPIAKRYARRSLVASLITLSRKENDVPAAWLYCLTYAFLLRVPSEALATVLGCNGETHGRTLPLGRLSCLSIVGNVVRLQLSRRKHRPHGSTLTRRCWCQTCSVTCPVHGLRDLLRDAVSGGEPFSHFSKGFVVAELRRRLRVLKIPFAGEFDTRCFRRGHAEEIARSSGSLTELLAAGEWTSKRFSEYLNKDELEDIAAREADGGVSSGDD